MKIKFTVLFFIVLSIISYSQDKIIIPIDTLAYTGIGNNTWYKGILKDTIVNYKEISVDTLIQGVIGTNLDTVFYIQYFEKGSRYINDTLFKTDYRKKEHGYLLNRKMVGHWDFTPSPTCFTNGTVGIDRRQYYQGEWIPNNPRDKYFFLEDSVMGFVSTENSELAEFSESIFYTCFKNEDGIYMCRFFLTNGLIIKVTPFEYMMDELNELLSGMYNREIQERYRNYNR